MNGMVVKRDEFFDSLKFFLISLVILGHTLEISEKTRVVLALYNTIYSFHMPLFIFISGYFSRKYDDNSLFYRKILGLVETYLTFQLVFSIPSILSGNIWTVIVRPWWVLWYLFSLITWRVILQITPSRFFMNDKWIITICIVTILSLLAGFLPLGYELSFQRTMTFMPFFTAGYICAIKKVKIKHILPAKALSFLYFFIVFVVVFYFNRSFSTILYGSVPYSTLLGLCGRFVQLILGCLGGICFMGLIKDLKLPYYMNSIGSNTLFFFIFHAIFIVAVKKLVAAFNFQFGFLHAIILYFLIMLILYALSHIHFFHLLLNPISSFYDKKNTCNRRG